MRALLLASCVVAAACGGDKARPAPPASRALGGDLVDPGAGAADSIVATVDGRPVWASCVEGHARARRLSVERALEDCIALELLAAEAVRRGLASDADTQDELRAALVDGFVGREFEDKITQPSDLPPKVVESNVQKHAGELDRPETRILIYARAPIAKDTPATAPEALAAKQLIDEIHAQVAQRDDWFASEFTTTVKKLAGSRKIEVATPRAGFLQADFGRAAYAIPAIGMVSPPTRTPWGWDVILLVDIQPAQKQTRDELVGEMFPGLRRGYFDQVWTAELSAGHAIEKYPEALDEPAEAAAP